MAHADDVIAGLDEVIEEPKLAEANVTTDAPADKEPVARAEDGKFKGKEEKQPEAGKEAKEPADKTIPVAAHAAERDQWKAEARAEKARADAANAQIAALNERLSKLEAPPIKTPDPVAIPAYEENPKGYLDANLNAAIAKLEGGAQATQKTVEPLQKSVEQLRADLEFTQFMGTVQQTQDAFIVQQPDYFDALNYIRQMRKDELTLAMPHLTKEQIDRGIVQEEVGLARALLQQGKNPHAVAYQIAQRRGYKPASAALELPKAPELGKPNQLAPDLTLGSSAGAGDDIEQEKDPIDIALESVFKVRKAS